MVFKQAQQFCSDLQNALEHYLEIDSDLASAVLDELENMETHLALFPEASPLTQFPPIRKYLMKRFPYRVRYSLKGNELILLTLESMSQNKPL